MNKELIDKLIEKFRISNIVLVDAETIGNVKLPEVDTEGMIDMTYKMRELFKTANIIFVDSSRLGDVDLSDSKVNTEYIYDLLQYVVTA